MNNQVSFHLDKNDFHLIDRRNFVISIGRATIERKGDDYVMTGDLNARDPDNAADVSQTASGNTAHGSFAIGADGKWAHTLDNANAEVNAVNANQHLTDSFKEKSAGGT